MKVSKFQPVKGQIFVTEMDEGVHRTKGGIILRDDQGSEQGIRSRWAKVAYIAEDIDFVNVGEWVLVEHGRWTPRVKLEFADHSIDVWKIDPKAILVVSDKNHGLERITF